MSQERNIEDQKLYRNRSISLPRLRVLRQSRGLSQKELGELAKVSSGTVYRWRTGYGEHIRAPSGSSPLLSG